MERIIYLLFLLLQSIIITGGTISKYTNISNELAINYQRDNIRRASDYALYKTIDDTKDLKADYSTINAINLDPNKNFEYFRSQYCMAEFGGYSQMTRRLFESRFICGILMVNDGYYLYEGDSNISMKIPYSISKRLQEKIAEIDDVDKIRTMLILQYGQWKKINITNGSQRIEAIPEDLMLHVINSLSQCISKEVNIRINNYFNTENQYMIRVPFYRTTGQGINPVTGVTSLWVMASENTLGDTPYIVLAGSGVEINQFCFGYEREGLNYYTTFNNGHKLNALGIQAKKLFKSTRVAAEQGYFYDIYMSDVEVD